MNISHHGAPTSTPLEVPQSTLTESQQSVSSESGFTRRGFLVAAGAVVAAGLILRNEIFGENKPKPKDPGDVLVNPEKFNAFVKRFEPIATQLAETEGVPLPYEVLLAVGMHESDSGTSELANNANNMHGIVAKDGWTGEIYKKPTEEVVSADTVTKLAQEHGQNLKIIDEYPDGRVRVQYPRPFRKYDKPEDSFADFLGKIYYKNQNGSYRYADVVAYLQKGGRDPHEVVRMMVDQDEPGELIYATGPEWLNGVNHYIDLVQTITGNSSTDTKPSDNPPKLPSNESGIDVNLIDFEELEEPRDKPLIERMKSAFGSLSIQDYIDYKENGVEKKWELVQDLIGRKAYEQYYNGAPITVKYIIWHAWASGVADGDQGTPKRGPIGNSHRVDPAKLVLSWFNNRKSSTQFILPDSKHGGKVWQLAKNPATKAGHIRDGIQDDGSAGREDADNNTTIGIEVQVDSIYDVEEGQIRELVLWTTDQLLTQKIVSKGMTREQTDDIIKQRVVGHGKNGGLEFGQKYSWPIVQAIQQYVFAAVQA